MRLSVVMTVFNGERHLSDAIDSVLAQTISDFEFLIVDDASTDQSPGLLAEAEQRDSRIRVLRNSSNLGPYPSLNRALKAARGAVIARQDADDISPPDRFAIQLAAFDSHPNVALVTGDVDMFDEEGGTANRTLQPPSWQPRLEWELMFSNVIGAGGHVMFPRVLGEDPILYATEQRYAEDYRLWCKLTRMGTVVSPGQVIYRYRSHASSITGRSKAQQDEAAAAIRREFCAPYLPSTTEPQVAEELSRFWAAGDGRPLVGRIRDLDAHLEGVRVNFLADVERRYGAQDRMRLEAELDEATAERLAYWLFRSARLLDSRACLDLLTIANTNGAPARIYGMALGYVARAVQRKLDPHRGR